MKTNSIFDFNRFGRLVAYDMRINGMANLLKLAAFILVIYFFILLQMQGTPYNFLSGPGEIVSVTRIDQNSNYTTQVFTNNQGYTSPFTYGLIFLAVYIVTSFAVMREKVNRTIFLLLPASTLEKYLYTFLIRVVAGFGLYLLVFWMDAQLARLTYEYLPFGSTAQFFKNGMLIKPDVFNYTMLILRGEEDRLILPFAIFSLATFLFACPLFFRKLQLLKTIFTFFVGLFLVFTMCIVLSHVFYAGEIHGFTSKITMVPVTNTFNNIALSQFLWACVSWPFFLLIGYFRLKESTQ